MMSQTVTCHMSQKNIDGFGIIMSYHMLTVYSIYVL